MTMTLIETITVGSGGAASIEFTGIPQDGKDLLVLLSARANTVQALWMQLNGSNSDFSGLRLTGTGSSVIATTETVQVGFINRSSSTANTFGNAAIYISNYASSTAKSISTDSVNENNDTSALQNINATIWDNTAAITSLLVEPQSGASYPFLEHTTASLYTIS